MKPLTKTGARKRALAALQTLKEQIDGVWPLTEAFTDLDDHPEEDQDGGFNHEVGYVRGLCEAFGLDPCALAEEIDGDWGMCPSCWMARPTPTEPGGVCFKPGSVCPNCGHVETEPEED